MKNVQIVALINGFANFDTSKKMNIKTAYAIMKNKKELSNAIVPYNESLKLLFEKYETTVEEFRNLPEKELQKLNKELDELLNIDVDVKIQKIKIEDFGDCDISINDMELLGFMIEE